jgi:hypothetical protein
MTLSNLVVARVASRSIARLAALAAVASLGQAQQKLVSVYGQVNQCFFGQDVSSAGDVNADGTPDFIAGAPGNAAGGGGRVEVRSGSTGALLHAFFGDPVNENFGSAVAGAGDVDADGFDDVIVGSAYTGVSDTTGVARVYSGQTGAVLYTFFDGANVPFAAEVAGVGDLDGDGHDDVIVGMSEDGTGGASAGRAIVHSGVDGSVLYDIVGATHERIGSGVDRAGDLDADGTPDFVIGGAGWSPSLNGSVRAFSGATGLQLFSMSHTGPYNGFGGNVSGAGDVNADGHADVLVSATLDDTVAESSGRVFVLSGADGSVIHDKLGPGPLAYFGSEVTEAGDYDGDGHADFIVGIWGYERAVLLSGANGQTLRDIDTSVGVDGFGIAIDVLGDVDADGHPDYVVGAWQTQNTRTAEGAAYVLSLEGLISNYCTSTPNSTGFAATMRSTGYGSVSAEDLVLIADHLPANKPSLFIASLTQVQVPFGNGFRCVGGSIKRLNPAQPSSPSGTLTKEFDHAEYPWALAIGAGDTWHFQAWFRDQAAGGAGFNLTDGLEVTFLP